MTQKLLILVTLDSSLRSMVDSWGSEDGDLIRPDKEIGLSSSPNYTYYKTPIHAIGDGWRLLAPPVERKDYPRDGESAYEWWLEK